VLAAAGAAHVLGALLEQVAETVFGMLGPDVALKLNVKAGPRVHAASRLTIRSQTAHAALEFLRATGASRADAFELAEQCRARFALATVFLPADEQAKLRQAVLEEPEMEDGNVETLA
jgi:hypothetical protein